MPFCKLTLSRPKPLDPAYPRELKTIGDHLRKRRLDLGLLQREAATRLGVNKKTYEGWECHRASPDLRAVPAVIRFLGYNPEARAAESLGGRIRTARRARGLSTRELARELAVDPSTVEKWEIELHHPPVKYWPRILALVGDSPVPEERSIAAQLLWFRRVRGLTQRELGQLLGLEQRAISEWERGREPTGEAAARLHELLNGAGRV